MTRTVAVVTPWRNHLELFDAYQAAVVDADELIVVDNASDPPLNFARIHLEENRGFSGGSNAGLGAASSEIVLFLNNDVVADDRNWLARIRDAVEPGVLVGAKLRTDAHGDVDGHRLPYLDGWCLAGMREDLGELGGFDEEYEEPAYYSDNDLCFRARLAGMTLREIRVGIRHLGGRTSREDELLRDRATLANRERFARLVRESMVAA